ncbi:MAG TPA: ferrochelatase [Rhodanobacteraceae bacterium]
MPRYFGFDSTTEHPDAPRAAVVLVNLGTPTAPTADAVGDYLAEFLSDPRVVELPRWLWWPILHGYILRTRPRRSAEAYAKVWRDDGSPLLVFSEQLAAAVGEEIARRTGNRVAVALGMTYGEPAVAKIIESLVARGVRRILALPLFPQYSATSSGAALDAVTHALQGIRWQPEVRTVTDYHNDAGYLAALAASVQTHWVQNGRGEKLLLSFHGIPEKYAAAGDPYPEQCHATASRLADVLGLTDDEIVVTFQSRLGRQPWLHPYTDEMLEQLAHQRVESIDVLCPGFAVDCLETLEEVALRYRTVFLTNGGKQFRYIPALNHSAAHATALAAIALSNLEGWY